MFLGVVSAQCTDTDGGKNYDVASSVVVGNSLSWDSCTDNLTLQEQFCENDQKQSESYQCPNGCFAGRCLAQNEIGEVFNIIQNQVQTIVFNGVAYEIDAPGCTGMNPPRDMKFTYQPGDGTTQKVTFGNSFYEPKDLGNGVIASVQGCGYNINLALSFNRHLECVDSDNGQNYFKKGVTHLFGEWYVKEDDTREDSCFNNGGNIASCSGDDCYVSEFSCGYGPGGKPMILSSSYRCLDSCKNGACIGDSSSQMSVSTDKDIYYDFAGESTVYVSTKLPKLMNCEQYFVSPSGKETLTGNGGCIADGESFSYSVPNAEYGNWKIKLILSDAEAPTQKYTIYSNDFEFLKKIAPTKETGPLEIQQSGENEIVPQEFIVCGGCKLDNKCYPYGFRKNSQFCSDTSNQFLEQKKTELVCDNNFECSSNVCVSSKCISPSLIDKILNWFKRLFGSN